MLHMHTEIGISNKLKKRRKKKEEPIKELSKLLKVKKQYIRNISIWYTLVQKQSQTETSSRTKTVYGKINIIKDRI